MRPEKRCRCLTLLQIRFTLPKLSPVLRWALTPPLHPYPFRRFVFCGTVCQEWECASHATTRSRPAVSRYFFRRSPDFPHALPFSLAAVRAVISFLIVPYSSKLSGFSSSPSSCSSPSSSSSSSSAKSSSKSASVPVSSAEKYVSSSPSITS